jgi:hypothetical protein
MENAHYFCRVNLLHEPWFVIHRHRVGKVRNVLCKIVSISHRRMHIGNLLKVETSKFLMMTQLSTSLNHDDANILPY